MCLGSNLMQPPQYWAGDYAEAAQVPPSLSQGGKEMDLSQAPRKDPGVLL